MKSIQTVSLLLLTLAVGAGCSKESAPAASAAAADAPKASASPAPAAASASSPSAGMSAPAVKAATPTAPTMAAVSAPAAKATPPTMAPTSAPANAQSAMVAMSSASKPAAAPAAAAGSDVHSDLKVLIPAMIQMLESKDYASVVKASLPPSVMSQLPAGMSPDVLLAGAMQNPGFADEMGQMLQALKAIKDQAPTLDATGNKATFTLNPPIGEHKDLTFVKEAGMWYPGD